MDDVPYSHLQTLPQASDRIKHVPELRIQPTASCICRMLLTIAYKRGHHTENILIGNSIFLIQTIVSQKYISIRQHLDDAVQYISPICTLVKCHIILPASARMIKK